MTDSRYRARAGSREAVADIEKGKEKHKGYDLGRSAGLTLKQFNGIATERKFLLIAFGVLALISFISTTRVQLTTAEKVAESTVSPNKITLESDRRQLEQVLNEELKSKPELKRAAERSSEESSGAAPQQKSMKEIMQAMMNQQNGINTPAPGGRQPFPQHQVAEATNAAIKLCMNVNPIMAANEVTRVVSWLRPGDIMLEYGSGSSSCVWSHFVKRLYSIDHDEAHVSFVRAFARQNHQLVAVPLSGEIVPGEPSSLSVFQTYVDLPNRLGVKFDVVLLDGRAKPQAALNAIPLLKDDGIVIMHNYHRPHYKIVTEWYDIIDSHFSLAVLKPKQEYAGIGVKNPKLPEWW